MKARIGQAVADALAHSWRTSPPGLTLSPEILVDVSNILLPTGGASLLWRRLRQSELLGTEASSRLQDAYRFHTLQAALRERDLVTVINFFHNAGVQPLLAKGWAVARLYPEKGLRPFGDIDLLIRPEQYARASAMMARSDAPSCSVDLHAGFRELSDRTAAQLFDRSQTALLHGVQLQVMGPEDQLRHLCLHMLADGMWRPLWLVDIALIAEAVPRNFDWDLCLAGDSRTAKWIACALSLAQVLLQADIGELPRHDATHALPRWLIPAVHRQWGKMQHYMHGEPMSVRLRHPRTLLRGLRDRWPNPIQATVGTRSSFSEAPRLPVQIAECVRRGAVYVRGMWKKNAFPGTRN